MTIEERMAAEKAIVRAAIEGLIAAGYRVVYDDGERRACPPTQNIALILSELHSTDEASLLVYDHDDLAGKSVRAFVDLVYGNDGFDVIADHSTNITSAMTTANVLADAMGDQAQAQLAIRTAVTEFAHVVWEEMQLNYRAIKVMPLNEARRFLDKHYPLDQ